MFKERAQKSLKRRTEKFIHLGKEKYGKNRYDYSIAENEYKNNRTPVHIRCNKCKREPFKVYPFAHTSSGDNEKGTCQNCYIPKNNIQETRWNPNLPQRIKKFKDQMFKRHGNRYSYPHLEKEYKRESSAVTVICNKCNSEPYSRKAWSLKKEDRYSGCEVCNKEKMAETIKKKNKKRQLRNRKTQHMPHEYGCIYKITNIKNRKFYIGYTTMTAKRRLKSHVDETRRMQKGKEGRSSYLHNAMNHHGVGYFEVEILEEYRNVTPYFLSNLEVEYIAKLKPHYNVSPGGEIGRTKILGKKKLIQSFA